MAKKYSFLSAWNASFVNLLSQLNSSNSYAYTYRPGGPLGDRVSSRVYANSIKSRNNLISKVLQERVKLLNLFILNNIDEPSYKPIMAALDAVLGGDLTNTTTVNNIIKYCNTVLSKL